MALPELIAGWLACYCKQFKAVFMVKMLKWLCFREAAKNNGLFLATWPLRKIPFMKL